MALFLEKTQDVMAISGYFREQKTEDKKSDAISKAGGLDGDRLKGVMIIGFDTQIMPEMAARFSFCWTAHNRDQILTFPKVKSS